MKFSTAFVIQVLSFTSIVAFADEIGITVRGLALGESMKEFSSKLPDFECMTNSSCSYYDTITCSNSLKSQTYSSSKLIECFDRNTFGGARIVDGNAYFNDGKLSSYRLTIRSNRFQDVIEALTDRFGKPISMQSTEVQNKLGAKYLNYHGIWITGETHLSISKFCGNIEKSCISVTSKSEMLKDQANTENQKIKNARDF